jgi:hypothetical protein
VHPSCITSVVALVAVILLFLLEVVALMGLRVAITFKNLTSIDACAACPIFVYLCNELLPCLRVSESSHRVTRFVHNEGNKCLSWIIVGKSMLI